MREWCAAEGLVALQDIDGLTLAAGVSGVSPFLQKISGFKAKRGIIRGDKGIVYIGNSTGVHYPDSIQPANGPEYWPVYKSVGKSPYKSADGAELDFAALGLVDVESIPATGP